MMDSQTSSTKHTLAFETQVVGTSREGRPIRLSLSAGAAGTTLDTLFIGVFHGDEGIAGELLERFQQFLTETGTDSPIHQPIGILPILNPDGLARQSRVNAADVDLNRNYPTADWVEDNVGTPYYSGSTPGGEPETQVILRLLETHRPAKIVSVHSPYKVINFDGPARALADAMAVHSGYPVVESIGYPTPGSFGTYVGIERGIPVITLELPEDEPLDVVWEDNRDSLLAAIAFQG